MLLIDPNEFVAQVTPLLARQDAHGLVRLVQSRWTLDQIARLLDMPHADVRKCASLALALIGTESCLEALAKQLRDEDAIVAQMAEHAMWSIWIRSGTDDANAWLVRGTKYFQDRHVEQAIESFSRAIDIDPDFAEAYNQRAMAHYVMEAFDRSAEDCRRVVSLMPMHFGAWAGLGNCYACLGKLQEAADCYRRAKQINPHLACVDDLIEELGTDAGA
jgi:tetratricopeptide (TPR) repeat protein